MRYRNCSADGAGFVDLGGSWVCGRCGCSNQGSCCAQCGWAYRTGGGVVNCGGNDGCGCERQRRVQCCEDTLQIRERGCTRENARHSRGDGCCGEKNRSGWRKEEMDCFCVQNLTEKDDDDCACRARRENEDDDCKRRKCQNDDAPYGNGCNQKDKEKACCKDDADGAYHRRGRAVGMVYAQDQELKHVYESESALQAGTLFPELHKPLNGYCPDGKGCGCDAQEAAFAAWELRLYLNTHPDDCEAMRLFRKLREETDKPNYATSFLSDGCAENTWDWVDDPWPWEKCANRCK